MEDFDVFTDEINYTKPLYMNILNKFVKDIPSTPNGANYHSARKLQAEECLAAGNQLECAFNLSESVSASLRTMAVYREEQLKANENKLYKITSFIKPVKDLIEANPISEEQEKLFDFLSDSTEEVTKMLKSHTIDEDVPLFRKYLRFSSENNSDNFLRILKELPKEWTIVQLTAPYNPNENIKPLSEYRTEINSIYLSVFTNDYLDKTGLGPININVPANVTKEGEKPLFTELYSLLDDNYKTIDNAQLLNNKRLVQNYWNRREDVDLRMKSVLNVMDKEWLGGWGSLLTGKLEDSSWRDKVIKLVDSTISDWGFIKMTPKQKVLLYNLIETCPVLNSNQIKSCIRKILTEEGNIADLRTLIDKTCPTCKGEFEFPNELCLKCLSKCFEGLHNFKLVDGIKAFSQAAKIVREEDGWSGLKKAKRHPVVLIVDEMLDTFPWETLPILNHHPVSRIENIHFLYYLYKMHESRVVDGYFNAKADVGRYVINPEKNLDRMEKRMSSFVEYWCGSWSGHIGEPPPPADFINYLTQADIFLYCGHGDGCRFANGGGAGAGVEGAAGTRAVTILSGCGSVRLVQPAPRAAPNAAHHHLHIAGCPMVVGMLWEVTDLEVDKVVSTLVSLYVPSTAVTAWPAVGKAKWSQGVLETNVEQKSEFTPEPNLLKAISRARGSTGYVMIASSVVARGLPVRIAQ
ncbi:uncharacterized protein LOC126375866 [Pectinophora gossypiella]|uniref:uncharacterized protein LOC126375866 n=1 Tax=Pectinophora gossypiella TaxID=13191 RepID=UPI00214F0141|nr:uncharacterized protein LOC126375866 [Pectinophora gossypiella]